MTVRVEGLLKTPLNTPAANIPIKIVTTVGAGDTLPTSETTYVTDANGGYGFDLVYATHEIYAMFDDTFELVGTTVTNESVPTPSTISELLHFSTPIQPEIVDQIYSDVYGCIGDLETDINTCMTCMSEQVVQGDTGVCQAMTVYTNECLQACSAEITTAIQAGDAQTLSQAQAYTDVTGTEIACCTEALSTSMSELCTTMVATTEANGTSIATLRTDMEAGDASIIQESKVYTDVCTGNVEASVTNMVRACDAAAYTCMGAISCCINVVEANASKTWYQDEEPVGANIGDLWYDTDNGNEPHYLSDFRVWESIRDASISVAQAEANAATASAHLACVCSCAYADGIVSVEEARAIADAQAKANAAELAACNYAEAEANLVAVCSCAYADGIVTAEEARAIADAQAKADAAQAAAIAASDTLGSAAAAEAAAKTYADAQANLACVCACAYADGIVTAEEARAIADAQAKADAAQSAAIAASDSLGSAAAAEQAACNYADANFVDSVTYGTDIAAIQQQLDKSITSWFGNDTPTTNNYPASDWPTDEEKSVHLGDLYYDNDDGLSYRWSIDEGVYLWIQVIDSGITSALEAASKAQDTADSKRRVFFGTPVPPYDRGDLWDTGQGLRRADATSTTTFSESHWLWATDANGAAESAGLAACNYALAQVNLEQVRADAYADEAATAAEEAAITAAEVKACAAAVDACIYADGVVTESESRTQAAYTAYADAAEAAAVITANAYADGVATEAEQAAICAAEACACAAEVNAKLYSDGCLSASEAQTQAAYKAYTDAAEAAAVVTSNAYADGVADDAELAAIAAANACTEAAEIRANAYADGIVTASEQATIDAANAYADAQDELAKTTSEAYADGVATQAELDAIAAAEQKVAEAEVRMQQEMDAKDTNCNAKIVACTEGLTGSIELMECDICDISEGVCLQQSGYEIVTCADDVQASISLLATSFSNTDVKCSEILMQADKIAMHNGNGTSTTYPFYVEGDNVYMNRALVNCLEGTEITSGILCSGEINATVIQSSDFNSCNNPAGGAPQGYCLGAGGDAELNNVIIRGLIEGSVICGTNICGGVIKGSAIQSSYIATDVPSLTLTWANQEQYGSMDLTTICGQGNTPYMGYNLGVVATCTATTPNLKIASYDYTGKTNYNRYTRRYITPYVNATSQILHCSSIACCYNVCAGDYPPPPAYNDGGVSVCLCFRGTGTDRRIDSGTIRNGQSITKVSGNTCVTFTATAYCCVYTDSYSVGGAPPRYNTQKWVETGYYVYASVKKHDYCANVTCFCTSLYTNASARNHRLCDAANNTTIPTSGGPS